MSTPIARELLDDLCSRKECGCVESQLAARVEAVLAHHRQGPKTGTVLLFYCEGCGEEWPCPTVSLLNGEEL